MKLTGGQIIVESLINEGVKDIFGYPGASIIPIYDALFENQDRINHYLTADEQGATHAADGYARSSGKVGVVLTASGPGATNTITGIATAFYDSVPLVIFTGQVPNSNIGSDSFQEVDIVSMVGPVTKYAHQVRDIKYLQEEIRKAFRIATEGRPGPVLIDLPRDIQTDLAELKDHDQIIVSDQDSTRAPRTSFDASSVQVFAEYINKAQKPLILAGGGIKVSGTSEILRLVAEKGDIPVVNSLMGQGVMDPLSPLSLGHVGMHGHEQSNYAMRNCDLLITLGARFSDRVTAELDHFAKNAKIIQVDVDITEIDKIIEINYSVLADLKDFMPNLLKNIDEKDRSDWINSINNRKGFDDSYTDEWTQKNIIKAIKAKMGPDAFVTTDVGQHQMWVSQYYGFGDPRKFITSGGFGTMGFGMGAAIGTQIANPSSRVVQISGDGSFRMNLNELTTINKYDLPIIVVVLNNNALGMVRQWQKLFNNQRYAWTDMPDNIDIVGLANAMELDGRVAHDIKTLEEAIDEGLRENKAMIIEANIDKENLVLPMIKAGGSYEDMIIQTLD